MSFDNFSLHCKLFSFSFERRKAEELPTWGRIFCEFIAAQWKCVHWFLSSRVSEQKYPQDNLYAKLCLQALDVVVEETAVPILQCLLILVPQVYKCFKLTCLQLMPAPMLFIVCYLLYM